MIVGPRRHVPAALVLASTGVTATVGNTVALTELFSTEVAANKIASPDAVMWEAWGAFARTATPSVDLRVELGSTALVFQLLSLSAGTLWHAKGVLVFDGVNVDHAGVLQHQWAASPSPVLAQGAASNWDNTAAITFAISAQWGAADPANIATLYGAQLSLLRGA